MTIALNDRTMRYLETLLASEGSHRIKRHNIADATVLDFGIEAVGGLAEGIALARICMADLATISLIPPAKESWSFPMVQVHTDQPVLACMASQYAGWQISVGKYFAMGSGPMRAAYGKEALFEHLPGREPCSRAVGVLECRKLPNEEVIAFVAERLRMAPDRLTLLIAPTASIAGNMQVVARSIETTLHKMHELKFDLSKVVSGYGTAPLPPVAKDDLAGIGRTNDSILYGGQVTLWVNCDDGELVELGQKVPSSASPDHGAPFADIFARYKHDFYKIDPMLFSPAVVNFQNLKTGNAFAFGKIEPDILRHSFFGGR